MSMVSTERQPEVAASGRGEKGEDADIDEDLDAGLEEMFDEPAEPALAEPAQPAVDTFVPESPERRKADDETGKPKSILNALLARRDTLKLTSHLSHITEEAANLLNTPQATPSSAVAGEPAAASASTEGPGTAEARSGVRKPVIRGDSRKRKADASISGELSPKSRGRKTRDAFRVVGGAKTAKTESHFVMERNVTNMQLRHAPLDRERLQALFEHSTRVDISQLSTRREEIRSGRLGEWVLFGCLVKKHAKRETKTGTKFAIWSVCNMPRWPLQDVGKEGVPAATMVTMLVFDEAYERLHTLVEGSAIAVRKAVVLPPRESEMGPKTERGGAEWSGLCVKIGRMEQVVRLGMCKDYRTCSEADGQLGQCGAWYDGNRLEMCVKHARKKRERLTRGSRMDINNAERPVLRGQQHRDAIPDAIDISRVGDAATNAQRWSHRETQGMELAAQQQRKLADEKLRAQQLGAGRLGLARSVLQGRATSGKTTLRAAERAEMHKGYGKRGLAMMKQALREEQGRNATQVRQSQYDRAVNALLKLGFSVGPNGDILAPDPAKLHGLRLKKGAAPDREEDLCLSDESS